MMKFRIFLIGVLTAGFTNAVHARPVLTGYAPVNGLNMYYEIYGPSSGIPLVLLHGGDPTIGTSWGKLVEPLANHRQVIAFEQQGHGRTADIADRPFSFATTAEDAVALLR